MLTKKVWRSFNRLKSFGAVQTGEVKVARRPHSSLPVSEGEPTRKLERDSSLSVLTGQGIMGLNRKSGNLG